MVYDPQVDPTGPQGDAYLRILNGGTLVGVPHPCGRFAHVRLVVPAIDEHTRGAMGAAMIFEPVSGSIQFMTDSEMAVIHLFRSLMTTSAEAVWGIMGTVEPRAVIDPPRQSVFGEMLRAFEAGICDFRCI